MRVSIAKNLFGMLVLMPWLISLFLIGTNSEAVCSDEMQVIGAFSIDKTEVSIEQFNDFAKSKSFVTMAEKNGGGLVYAAGWERKQNWTWSTPYGRPSHNKEPAVHVTFDEAKAYCNWRGKRLPTELEWLEAAYTERRANPPKGFIRGRTYEYPTGETPVGANCLSDCGSIATVDYSDVLMRGNGHVKVQSTLPGVNGLYDMGANVWEWVETDGVKEKGTRGGSWWYGATQMKANYKASKPRDMAAVYIGFRCAKGEKN
mgnify:FL=1